MKKLNCLYIVYSIVTFVAAQSYDECVNEDGKVNCNYLGWTSLPPELPEDIIALKITGGSIQDIPKSSLTSRNLKSLGLLEIGLKTLSGDQFLGLPKIQSLKIVNNSISNLPANLFANNPEIRMLDLSNNKIKELPETLFNPLKNLFVLNVERNQIQYLPNYFLANQKQLMDLDGSYNNIESIGDYAFEGASMITKILLSHNKLVEIPDEMFQQIPDIYYLDISYNQIKSFPWQYVIDNTNKKMVHLSIRSNEISRVPKNFFKDVRLTKFEFGDNPLWCDCDLDWMRAKQWLGIDLAKSGTDINFITFASGVHDKQTQKCAGPGIFTGKFPWDFDTLCDTDECETMEKPCKEHSTCVNTAGSWKCPCLPGFFGDGKKAKCSELDECKWGLTGMKAACPKNTDCINTVGSYECKCKPGYRGDKNNCEEINECKELAQPCPKGATCVNTPGSFTCECPAGLKFGMDKDEKSCVDINECEGDHGCKTKCYNTIGSFTCDCEPGYKYSPNGECYDADECSEGEDKCSEYASCVNTPGSYSCKCITGFLGDGISCKDIDECMLNLHRCHHNATCTNTVGSHVCRCKAGLHGNGIMCSDYKTMMAGRLESGRFTGSSGGGGNAAVIVLAVILGLLLIAIGAFVFVKGPAVIFGDKVKKFYGEQPMTRDDAETFQPLTASPAPPP